MTTSNGRYKIDVEKRIATLEANYQNLSDMIENIRDNHLHELREMLETYHKEALDKYDKIVWWLIGSLLSGLFALLLQLAKML